MRRILIMVSLVLITALSLTSCMKAIDWLTINIDKNGQYYLGAGWDCDDETFANEYYPLYYNEIQRLKTLYGLECQERVDFDTRGDSVNFNVISYCLYSNYYTICLYLNNNGIAEYNVCLYYFVNDKSSDNHDDLTPLLGFINDFTNYVAYDTRTDCNHFERLFNDAVLDGKYADYLYHYDSLIGNVGYTVYLSAPIGYYYMAEFNSELEKSGYRFTFDGLLKPLL